MTVSNVSIKALFSTFLFLASFDLYALDMRSVLIEMIDTNPELKQKRQELSASQYELEIARSGFLPKIDVRSSTAKERASTQMTGFKNREFNTLNTDLAITQNLFSGFLTDSEMGVKRQNVRTKSYELDEKINDLSLRLIKSYLDVLKAHELLNVERENAKVHENIYQKITLKVESGSGRTSDHKEVLAKLALSYVNSLTQDNNYNDAATVLHTLIGHYLDVQTLEKPSIDSSMLPHTLDAAVAEAVQNNPSVMVSRSEMESAKKSVDVERSTYYPKVDASLNARNYDNANGSGNTDKTASAMVTLNYNLYNGGSDEARIKRGLSQSYDAIERLHSSQRAIAEKMAMAYNAYTVLSRQKPFLELYSEANFEKTHLYHEEFDLGRRSLIDLLDSESEYGTARRKAIENEYDLLYSFFRVLAAKNELVPYFNIETDRQSALKPSDQAYRNSGFVPSVGEYPMIPIPKMHAKEINLPEKEHNVTRQSVAQDTKGYEYHLKAARSGDPQSQCKLVHLYEQGIGTAKSTEKASYWKKRCVSTPKGEPLTHPAEKAKSLDDRLRELGIRLHESENKR